MVGDDPVHARPVSPLFKKWKSSITTLMTKIVMNCIEYIKAQLFWKQQLKFSIVDHFSAIYHTVQNDKNKTAFYNIKNDDGPAAEPDMCRFAGASKF